jgi:glycerol-3-phosphate cytidylyltransferase-like family protein
MRHNKPRYISNSDRKKKVKRVRPVEMVVEEARVDVEEKHQQDRDYIDERQQGEDQERFHPRNVSSLCCEMGSEGVFLEDHLSQPSDTPFKLAVKI